MKRRFRSSKSLICFMLLTALAISSLGLSATRAFAVQATYYVDLVNGSDSNAGTSSTTAFKTITKAQSIVRTVNSNMTDDIIVNLRGGTYKNWTIT